MTTNASAGRRASAVNGRDQAGRRRQAGSSRAVAVPTVRRGLVFGCFFLVETNVLCCHEMGRRALAAREVRPAVPWRRRTVPRVQGGDLRDYRPFVSSCCYGRRTRWTWTFSRFKDSLALLLLPK